VVGIQAEPALDVDRLLPQVSRPLPDQPHSDLQDLQERRSARRYFNQGQVPRAPYDPPMPFLMYLAVLLAAVSRVLRRDRWPSLLPQPGALYRWLRELVRRKWTRRSGGQPGPPPLHAEVLV